ncbi:MAG: hypothetical protein ACREX8_00230 [Gammaproteobacteria bacterium]
MPVVRMGHDDGRITRAVVPDEYTPRERFLAVTHDEGANRGVWVSHSDQRAPVWVDSDDPGLADELAEFYFCPIGAPQFRIGGESDQS